MITRGVPFTLYCSFIASEDTGYFVWGGVDGDRVFWLDLFLVVF